MANQRDLKAFVRYDGSGRVVAGSLVLRKKKPKVGRWQEILTYECCNDVPSTTTTTTTGSGTTTSTTTSGPNSFSVTWISPEQTFSCELPRITVYSSSNVISNGTRLFRNSNLTNELQDGTLYVQVLPFGETSNMRSGTYVEGNGLYALNGITTCDAPTTTTTTTV
jgi:hypothetical protein